MLNHDCITPLYVQIANQIKDEVHNGRFREQRRLPPEKAISEQY